MANPLDMPTWLSEALTGAVFGLLGFIGLTLLLVGGGAILVYWL